MKNILIGFTCIAMLTCWYSCTKDTAPAPVVVTGNCDSTKVNFTKDLKPIIDGNCLGSSCHSSGTGESDFTSLVVVKTDIDNILCRIRASGTTFCGAIMPQNASQLPDSIKNVFVKWKADGMYDCQ